MARLRVVVTGLIAQHPLLGGMTWHYLQYLLGLDQLGHDVYYLEDSGEWPYNLDGGASGLDFSATDCAPNVAYLQDVMKRFGLEDRWLFRCPIDGRWFGLSSRRREEVLTSADLLLNISGTLARPEEYQRIERLAYVDTDPFFTQLRLVHGEDEFAGAVAVHDAWFSFGERLPEPLVRAGHQWRPTRQPIALSEWRPSRAYRNVATTVMNWASYDTVFHDGRMYGQKDVEFARFLELPQLAAPIQFEVSVRGTSKGELPGSDAERSPQALIDVLKGHGWRVMDPIETCGGFESYRRYIESSKVEWSVAKNAYVDGRSGWFSDRSACYLAAGRPVVLQDTGFSEVLPVGEGLLAFKTLDEAAAAILEVETRYALHARAARAIAEEYLDAGKVLSRLIEAAAAEEVEGGR